MESLFKKVKRPLALMLAVAMVLTSTGFVYAGEDVETQTNSVVSDSGETGTEVTGETVPEINEDGANQETQVDGNNTDESAVTESSSDIEEPKQEDESSNTNNENGADNAEQSQENADAAAPEVSTVPAADNSAATFALAPRITADNYDLSSSEVTNSLEATIKIDGVPLKKGESVTVNYGEVEVVLSWGLLNNVVLTGSNTITYSLPTNISFTTKDGPLKDGATTVGTYSISNNMITLKYTDETFCKRSGRVGALTFWGTLGKDGPLGPDGGDTEFSFPGVGTFPVNVNRDTSNDGVSIYKSDAKRLDADNISDDFRYEFVLTVTSTGTNTNVAVTDTMEKYLHLSGSPVVYTDEACTTPYTGSVIPETSNQGFKYTIASMANKEKLYIKYTTTLDKEAYAETKYDERKNTAKVSSTEKPNEQSSNKAPYINKTWGGKSGSYNNGVITWTLYVNNGGDQLDINGTKIKDELRADQTYNNNIKVEEADWNSNNWSTSSLNIGWDALTSTTGYEFTSSTTKKYRITYTTTPTNLSDVSAKEYTNRLHVYPLGTTVDNYYTGKVTIGTDFDYIDKSCLTSNGTSNTAKWQITVKIPTGGLSGVYVTEQIPEGMTYKAGSLTVTNSGDTGFTGTPTVGSVDDNRNMRIDFGNLNAGNLVFTLETSIDSIPDTTKVYTNNVIFMGGNTNTRKANATYTYNVAQYLSKDTVWVGNRDNGGLLGWKLMVSGSLPSDAQNVSITDTLPEDNIYVADSLVLPTDLNDHVTVNYQEATVVFTLDSTAIAYAGNHGGFDIKYNTKITHQTEQKTYTNKAYITVDGSNCKEVSSDYWHGMGSVLDKTAAYNSDTTPEIIYTITINSDANDLNPDGDTVTLTDTMNQNLSFVVGSLKNNGVAVSQDDYTYDFDNNQFRIELPDNQVNVLTYSAYVTLPVGTDLNADNAGNTCELSGGSSFSSNKTYNIGGKVLQSSGVSSAEGVSLRLYKYSDNKPTNALGGAEFEVYVCDVDRTSWKIISDSTRFGGTFVTSSAEDSTKGYVNVDGLVHDTVYKIVETKAPDNHVLDSTPHYVVFYGSDNIDWTTVGLKNIDGSTVENLSMKGSSTATVTLSDENFNNNMVPAGSTTATLTATKTVDNKEPAEGETFDFKLTPGANAPGTEETVQNNKGTVTFSTLTFDTEGTYTYTIQETGEKVGYSYDKTVYTATVEVTKDAATNKLVAAVSYKAGEETAASMAFKNTTVAADATTVTLTATKTVDNKEPAEGETFDFKLTPGTDAPGTEETKQNVKGTVTFSEITFDKEGTYTYTIQETGEKVGYSYDKTAYTATVVVTKDATTNKLEAAVSYKVGEDTRTSMEFKNTTIPAGVATVALTATKTVDNKEPAEGEKFDFKLTPGTNAPGKEETVQNIKGTVTFSDISFTEEGTYTYTIQETGEKVGYSYDKTAYTATVVVTKDANTNKLEAAVSYKAGEATAASMAFKNTTVAPDAAKVTFTASKTVDNKEPAEGETFDFKLTPGTDAPGTEETVQNVKGTVSFSEITFDKEGTYTYTIQETGEKVGYSYDKTAYIATVDVTKDTTTNKLVPAVSYKVGEETAESMTFKNAAIRDVVISKTDINGTKEIGGAKLEITDSEGTVVDKWDSVEGTSHTAKLVAGTYTLTEKTAPQGYDVAESITFTVDEDGKIVVGSDTVDKVQMKDALKKRDVVISKTDINGTKEIGGAKLVITDSEGTAVDSWDSVEGESHTAKLAAGTYTLTETTAPQGYTVAESITFVVGMDGKVTVDETDVNGKVQMKDDTTKVEFSKVDATDGAELPGATITIYETTKDAEGNTVKGDIAKDANGENITWVSSTEKHVVEGALVAGNSYIMVETQAPAGYETAEEVTFTVNEDGKLQPVKMEDARKTGTVTVEKADRTDTTNKLYRAKYALYRVLSEDGVPNPDTDEKIDEKYTDENGTATFGDLPFGIYYFKEVEAPAGFTVDPNPSETFEIKADNVDTDFGGAEGSTPTVVPVTDDITRVTISKQDITNGNELPGAVLEIQDKDGNVITLASGEELSWTSTDTAKYIEYLPIGEYKLVEKTAPNGYVVAESIDFAIDDYGVVSVNGTALDDTTVVMKDDTTKVTISKVAITGGDELPGATLVVLDKAGNEIERWVSTTTKHEINGKLTAGETYTLREITAPNGYEIANDISFTVNTDGKVQMVEMIDEAVKAVTPTPTVKPTTTPASTVKPTGTASTNTSKTTTVNTSDNTMLFGMIVVLILAAEGVGVIGYSKKKRKVNQ